MVKHFSIKKLTQYQLGYKLLGFEQYGKFVHIKVYNSGEKYRQSYKLLKRTNVATSQKNDCGYFVTSQVQSVTNGYHEESCNKNLWVHSV